MNYRWNTYAPCTLCTKTSNILLYRKVNILFQIVQAPLAPSATRSVPPIRWKVRSAGLGLAAVANACAHPVFDERIKELRGHERVFPLHSSFPVLLAREALVLRIYDTLDTRIGFSDPLQRVRVLRAAFARLFDTRWNFEGQAGCTRADERLFSPLFPFQVEISSSATVSEVDCSIQLRGRYPRGYCG